MLLRKKPFLAAFEGREGERRKVEKRKAAVS